MEIMKTFELVRAYWRLWFPPVPESGCDQDLSFVVSFVKEHAQGNISLQAGKFLTRSRHDKMIDELEGYRFSA